VRLTKVVAAAPAVEPVSHARQKKSTGVIDD